MNVLVAATRHLEHCDLGYFNGAIFAFDVGHRLIAMHQHIERERQRDDRNNRITRLGLRYAAARQRRAQCGHPHKLFSADQPISFKTFAERDLLAS